jgi:serine/threonine-protein kinase
MRELTPEQLARVEAVIEQLAQADPAEKEQLLASLDDDVAEEILAFTGACAPGISTLPAGLVLGDCCLGEPLGAGGCGAVYGARQSLGGSLRAVAIKVLRPELFRPQMLDRFEAEIALLAQLSRERHAGIVQVFRSGRFEIPGTGREVPYVVMERVEGRPLDAFVRRLPGLGDRVRLMSRVCEAVQAIHGVGLIHGDLKPDNILVTSNGQPVLLDFGMAQLRRAELPLSALGGTVPYMAPEHFGGRFTAKADVYALGVLMFSALTGSLPYVITTGDAPEFEAAICAGKVRMLRDLQADVPKELDAIAGKALELLPKDRFASAGEMSAALEEWLRREDNSPSATVEQDIVIDGESTGQVTGVRSKPNAKLPEHLHLRHKVRVKGGSAKITGFDFSG